MKAFFFALLFFFPLLLPAQALQGTILFSRTRNNIDSLFALRPDGSLDYITNGFRPRISRKGRLMLFTRNTASPGDSYGASMWVRNLITQQETLLLTNNDYLDLYDFSPSDREIVYSQQCNMYKMNADGTNPYTYLACNPCNCYSDSPKARISDSLLAYHNVFFGLYTIRFNGTESTKIPRTKPGDLYPVWSPDGQWLAYTKCTFGGYYVPNDLCKIRPDGSDSIGLTQLTATDTLVSDPFWARDGQSVYVIGRIAGQAGLYRVSASGNGHRSLVQAFPNHISIRKYTLGLADSVPTQFTSVAPQPRKPDFSLVPNPVKEGFSLPGLVPGTPFRIFSSVGRLVKEAQYEGFVPVRDLPAGMYTLVAGNPQKPLRFIRE